MRDRSTIIENAVVGLLISIMLLSSPIGILLGFGIDSLKNGKNTGGLAIIVNAENDEVRYGHCLLTLSFFIKDTNSTMRQNLTALCMPDPVGKQVPICYNRWKPANICDS